MSYAKSSGRHIRKVQLLAGTGTILDSRGLPVLPISVYVSPVTPDGREVISVSELINEGAVPISVQLYAQGVLVSPDGRRVIAVDDVGGTLGGSIAVVQFTTASVSQAEGNAGTTTFTYVVTRSGDTSGACSVDWAVSGSGGNPASASDFVGGTFPSGTVSFLATETTKNVVVNVAGDATVEASEGFTVALSNPVTCSIGAASTASGTILNDDGATAPTIVDGNGVAAPSSLIVGQLYFADQANCEFRWAQDSAYGTNGTAVYVGGADFYQPTDDHAGLSVYVYNTSTGLSSASKAVAQIS